MSKENEFKEVAINIDECKYLILKMIEQTVRDFINLEHSSVPIEIQYYESACQFLFDDEYYIDYGGTDKNLENLLDILDINIKWFRERVVKIKNSKIDKRVKKRKNHDWSKDQKKNKVTKKTV